MNAFLAGVIHPGGAPSPTPISPFGPSFIHINFLLTTLIWLPVLAALLIAVLPNPRGRFDARLLQIAFWANAVLLFLTLVAYNQSSLFSPAIQYEEKVPWLPAFGIYYHLGVDGLTVPLLFLASLIGVVAVLASASVRERVREYFALLLLIQASVNGVLCARDLFLLVLFWAGGILPTALLLAGWGGPGHSLAARRYLAYALLGSGALLAAVLVLFSSASRVGFDLDALAKNSLNPRVQVALAALLIVAAATRLPLVPFHGWARDAYSEAETGVAVLVAGLGLPLGGYLLFRLLLVAQHDGARLAAPFLGVLAALTVLYAALAALRSRDLRRFGAYAAMISGGVFVLGIAALTPIGLLGAALQLIAGGLAAALVVGVAATISQRAQTRELELMHSLGPRMPKLSWILVMASFGIVGLPGFASFIGEAMVLFGSFRNQPAAAFGVVLGLVLMMIGVAVVLQRIVFGAARSDSPGVSDASLGEMWYLGLLAGALIWWGVLPGGPKLGGAVTLFDPGIVNVLNTSVSDIAAPYVPEAPAK